ncbi:MAG: FAD-dependent oxidoreductase [Moorellales bacterium]
MKGRWALVLVILLAVGLVLLGARWEPGAASGPSATPEDFQVVVVGAEPEGIAAALAAARSGAEVLLLERRPGPGGLYTYGWLNTFDLNYAPGSERELVTRGIFMEFFREAGGSSFDVEHLRRVFERLLRQEPGIEARYGVARIEPVVDDAARLVAVRVRWQGETREIRARAFVDATADADLAAAAGVPWTYGGRDHGSAEALPATLVFRLGGVDWQEVQKALNRDASPYTGADAVSAWGFGSQMGHYRPSHPRLRLPDLNLGRQRDGTVLVNGLQIRGVNGLDPDSCREAYELAQRELPAIVAFMRSHLPGFGRAELLGVAPELYIRETRHIRGEYTLTVDDVLGNRYFPDQIGVGSYPVDLKRPVALGKPLMYSLPFRCLVPQRIDNLLVVGRSASFTSLAAGSARVVPVGVVAGQAAGVAAAMAAREGVTPRQIARDPSLLEELQNRLRLQGAYLPVFRLKHAVAGHWAYPAVRELQRLGLVAGGYDNRYYLEDSLKGGTFMWLARTAFALRHPEAEPPPEAWLPSLPEDRPVQFGPAARYLGRLLDWYAPGHRRGFVPAHPRLRALAPDQDLNRAQAYTLIVEALAATQPAR